jgi:hypothetical protein
MPWIVAVTRSLPERSVATRAIVYPVSSLA